MRIHIVATAAGRDLLSEHFTLDTDVPRDLSNKVLGVAVQGAQKARGEEAKIESQEVPA